MKEYKFASMYLYQRARKMMERKGYVVNTEVFWNGLIVVTFAKRA